MKLYTICVIIALVLMPKTTWCQRETKKAGNQIIRLGNFKKELPSVYISYEKSGIFPSLYEGESDARYWFRLHNNTKFKISVIGATVPKEYGDYEIPYTIQAEQQNTKNVIDVPLGRPVGHRTSYVYLKSNESFLFSLPQEHLTANLYFTISFNYEWEVKNLINIEREPIHLVSFHSINIPLHSKDKTKSYPSLEKRRRGKR